MVATPAMAWLGLGPACPAAAKQSGTISPRCRSPISANPVIAVAGCPASTISSPPSPARTPPARTVRTAPKRFTTASPAIRATAMVSMNPVVQAAASPAELSSRSWRNTADQSRLAPSANTAQKPTAPISSAGARRQREPRRGFLVLAGLEVQHPGAGRPAEQGEDGRREREVQARVRAEVRGEGAGRGADQGARAPHPVQPRHDGLPEQPLHLHAERVHRDIGHARARAVGEHRQAQGDQVRRHRRQHQGQRPQGEQPAQRRTAAEAVADPARQRHRAGRRRTP